MTMNIIRLDRMIGRGVRVIYNDNKRYIGILHYLSDTTEICLENCIEFSPIVHGVDLMYQKQEHRVQVVLSVCRILHIDTIHHEPNTYQENLRRLMTVRYSSMPGIVPITSTTPSASSGEASDASDYLDYPDYSGYPAYPEFQASTVSSASTSWTQNTMTDSLNSVVVPSITRFNMRELSNSIGTFSCLCCNQQHTSGNLNMSSSHASVLAESDVSSPDSTNHQGMQNYYRSYVNHSRQGHCQNRLTSTQTTNLSENSAEYRMPSVVQAFPMMPGFIPNQLSAYENEARVNYNNYVNRIANLNYVVADSTEEISRVEQIESYNNEIEACNNNQMRSYSRSSQTGQSMSNLSTVLNISNLPTNPNFSNIQNIGSNFSDVQSNTNFSNIENIQNTQTCSNMPPLSNMPSSQTFNRSSRTPNMTMYSPRSSSTSNLTNDMDNHVSTSSQLSNRPPSRFVASSYRNSHSESISYERSRTDVQYQPPRTTVTYNTRVDEISNNTNAGLPRGSYSEVNTTQFLGIKTEMPEIPQEPFTGGSPENDEIIDVVTVTETNHNVQNNQMSNSLLHNLLNSPSRTSSARLYCSYRTEVVDLSLQCATNNLQTLELDPSAANLRQEGAQIKPEK